MKRQAIRGFVLLAVLVAVIDSNVRAQNTPDKITVRDRKDGSTKNYDGAYTLSPAGFQILGTDKKAVATINPDDVTKVAIGDLPGIERSAILSAMAKEFPAEGKAKEYDAARTIYVDQLKKPNLQEKSKRYLEFKKLMLTHKLVDELDADKGWKEKADACITEWNGFLALEETKFGWEQWPATRACTRLMVERGKYDDAARAWSRVAKNPNMPPDAKVEAGIQEIDLQIRGKSAYSAAATSAGELIKTAAGAKKDRLVIYEIAAKAGDGNKFADGIEKIKAEMNKTKDPSVHATGYSMMGELYLADKKPRDAMWMFLWVETVVNQDRDEAFKAISRLSEMFEGQMDEEQSKKYHEKLKKFRASF